MVWQPVSYPGLQYGFGAAPVSSSHPFVVSSVIKENGNAGLFRDFVDDLSRHTGYPLRLVYVNSEQGLSQQLQDDPMAVGWTCGAAVVGASMRLVQLQAENRAIQIVNTVDECGDVVLCADFTRLRQILVNLLGNAIKYNYTGGGIKVSCRILDNKLLYLDVAGTGKGIREDDLGRLFTPFERLDVRHNVQGSTFYVGLPLSESCREEAKG